MSTWYDTVRDVTVSNSIISEGLWHSLHPDGPHSKGFLVGYGTHNLSVIGNLFAAPLAGICEDYDVGSHAVTGPLHRGGPVELARVGGLPVKESYADACQMCFEARLMLRERFGEILTPDQMYGDPP